MDEITFKRRHYPVRSIELEHFGMQKIGIESLEDAMFDEELEFVNDEAENIDSQIFYYVPDEIIDDEEKIKSYLNRHLF